jgi:hypothetical protein
MNMKKILAVAIAGMGVSGFAQASSFVNGGFESGLTGWTGGGGSWNIYTQGVAPVDPLTYAGGPSNNTVMTGGVDPITGATTVFAGSQSVRLNDSVNNYSVSTLTQSITNYTDTNIYFQWNAVLESSHDVWNSDYFSLTLHDDTTHTDVLTRSFSSASAPGTFTQFGNWYGSGWQLENIDLTHAGAGGTSIVGDDFTLSLLASDCPYGGHAGYVYLDGFAPVIIPQGQVPEPASLALMGLGVAALAAIRRKKSV